MKISDAIFGVLLMLIGAVVLVVVQGFPKIPGQQVGPAMFPGLIAAGLCICGAILTLRGWRERAVEPWVRLGPWARMPRHVLALLAVVVGVVFYMLAGQALGFLVCASLVLLACMLALGVRPGLAVLVAVVASLVIHFAFYKLLRVPLPWGVLQPIAW
ncbi:tripartite tricarboxylate transporter TctB family protein [Variovorax dokdonensis]|uniref:Tripartite tricarboxylate transporter TctB family protein n=1 Tax=Variovorax dokdonensis TaxID=344883 RepID=A0ABT7N8J3_9BURK|nr:tripartite tricarboxylate transporter TctB family protein [Variovorax dokdonensis]MDM0044258.1 tripartite tricarboxylate transporter TctB family protein [Variovorax dokdonensis]